MFSLFTCITIRPLSLSHTFTFAGLHYSELIKVKDYKVKSFVHCLFLLRGDKTLTIFDFTSTRFWLTALKGSASNIWLTQEKKIFGDKDYFHMFVSWEASLTDSGLPNLYYWHSQRMDWSGHTVRVYVLLTYYMAIICSLSQLLLNVLGYTIWKDP